MNPLPLKSLGLVFFFYLMFFFKKRLLCLLSLYLFEHVKNKIQKVLL